MPVPSQICAGLDYAHRIIDFGIAKAVRPPFRVGTVTPSTGPQHSVRIGRQPPRPRPPAPHGPAAPPTSIEEPALDLLPH